MANQYPVEIDGATGEVEPLPPQKGQRYRCKLGDIDRGIVNAGTQYRRGLKAPREQPDRL